MTRVTKYCILSTFWNIPWNIPWNTPWNIPWISDLDTNHPPI